MNVVMPWRRALYEENYIFMTQKGSEFDVQHPQTMKDRHIALLRGAAQAAMAALVADGTQKRIFRQYGLA